MSDTVDVECRNAQAEARARIGEAYEVRVLEPSPPAVADDFGADDPVARGDVPAGRRVISPVGTGDELWIDLDADDPELAGFCMTRWLGPYKPLRDLPISFSTTRHELHRVALHVVSRARRELTGKIGLRWTLGGFGTPFFGEDEQVRVDGDALVHQRAGGCTADPLTTLREAAEVVGIDLDLEFDHGFADVIDVGDLDAPLQIDVEAALALGDWYGFAWSVLEELRHELAAFDPTRPQLWPEHFDAGFDASCGRDQRVNFGASPGDGFSDDPYLYVGPWAGKPRDDDYWNAGFGAALTFSSIVAAPDQRALALDFLRQGHQLLRS